MPTAATLTLNRPYPWQANPSGFEEKLAQLSMTLASISIGAPHAQTSSSGSTDSALAATGWGILDRRGFAGLLLAIFLDSMVQTSVLVFIAFLMLSKGVTLSLATLAA